jgi:hypothetical protein
MHPASAVLGALSPRPAKIDGGKAAAFSMFFVAFVAETPASHALAAARKKFTIANQLGSRLRYTRHTMRW